MPEARPYTSQVTIPLRYADLDTLGHVNQAVYHVILEEGRGAFLVDVVGDALDAIVVARVELDHRHEIRIDDRQVTVETSLEHVGRSSIRLRSRITTPSGVLAAEGTTVLVAWDMQARRSRPLGNGERARLAAVVVPAPTAD